MTNHNPRYEAAELIRSFVWKAINDFGPSFQTADELDFYYIPELLKQIEELLKTAN